MCGRFVSSSGAAEIASYFGVEEISEHAAEHRENYNTAPTSDVLVVLEEDGRRELDTYRWGLVPRWAKDTKIGNRLINARAETLADKPAFRAAFRRRRCLVPADGFYEWTAPQGGGRKQPWYITAADGEPLAFAGLWEQWRGRLPAAGGAVREEDEEEDREAEVTLRSVTIVTGEPNAEMATVHDRMPVILPAASWAEWLDPRTSEVERLESLLVPAPSGSLSLKRVSTDVNDMRNRGRHLIDPAPSDQE